MNRDVVESVAAFLGISVEELLQRHDNYLQHQLARWQRLSPDGTAALADFYNDNLYLYELISTPSFGVVRLVAPFLRPGSAILDYGSGIGTHGFHFLRQGHDVTFVDLPSPHFDFVRWQAHRSGLAAEFVEAAVAGSLPEKTFDAVFCFDVLEHVLEWREAVRDLARLLKPDGKFFVIVSFREFEAHAIHISSRTGLAEASFRECMTQNGLVEIFHRDRPVPLTHPLESFRVFARAASAQAAHMVRRFADGEHCLRAGAMAEAERCFADVLAWNPEDFSAHRALARIFMEQEKLTEAGAEADKVLELLPEDAGALEIKADICMKSGDGEAAARRYAEVIANQSEHAEHSKQALASLLEAGLSFERACGHIVDWRMLQSLLGYLVGIRRFAEAEPLAARLTAMHPRGSYAGYLVWKEYARLLRETGRIEEAVEILQQLLPLHRDRLWLHYDLCLCHAAAGNIAAALAELDEEERRSPFRAAILFERGMLCRKAGDLRSAMAAFKETAALSPENGAAHWELGRTALQMDDPVGALRALSEAARQMPDNAEVLLERGRTARQLGERALALSDLRRVAELDASNAQIHFELAELEWVSRHYWKAVASFDAAYRLAPERVWPRLSPKMKLAIAARGLASRLRAI
jgi:tetratricopeptide (TPR) repeat protein